MVRTLLCSIGISMSLFGDRTAMHAGVARLNPVPGQTVRILMVRSRTANVAILAFDECAPRHDPVPWLQKSLPDWTIVSSTTAPGKSCAGETAAAQWAGPIGEAVRSNSTQLEKVEVTGRSEALDGGPAFGAAVHVPARFRADSSNQGLTMPLDSRTTILEFHRAGDRSVLAVVVNGPVKIERGDVNAEIEKRVRSSWRRHGNSDSPDVLVLPTSPEGVSRFEAESVSHGEYLDRLVDSWRVLRDSEKTKYTGGPLKASGRLFLEGAEDSRSEGTWVEGIRIGRWTLLFSSVFGSNNSRPPVAGKSESEAYELSQLHAASLKILRILDAPGRRGETGSSEEKRAVNAGIESDLYRSFDLREELRAAGSRRRWRLGAKGVIVEGVSGREPDTTSALLGGGEAEISIAEEGRRSDPNGGGSAVSLWVRPLMDASGHCSSSKPLIAGYGVLIDLEQDCSFGMSGSKERIRVDAGRWTHMVLIAGFHRPATVFVDGRRFVLRGNASPERAWRIGGGFVGRVADLAVWGRPLSDRDVGKLMRGRKKGTSPGPAPFDNPFPASSGDPEVVRH